jgi:glyoxylase-like metal-dependent hydrolase (beta-lactamase superfamily II)
MQRTTVGSVEVTALVDTEFAFPATSLFSAVDPAAIEAYSDLLTDDGAVNMICGQSILQADGQTILVDTGNGPDGNLFSELEAAGVAPADVDIVVFTHLHGDHTGWNIDRATGAALFPNARYWIPRADWDHFGAQGGDNWTGMLAPLEGLGVVELFEGETQLSASLTLVETPGHTPGHTSIQISSDGETAFVLGDAVVDEVNLNEPDWANMFDGDDPTAIATRHRLIPQLTESGELIVASHLGNQGLGHITRDGERLRFKEL